MAFTASQVATILCEAWSSSAKMRLDTLLMTMASDVRISSLDSGAVLARGHAAVEKGWAMAPEGGGKAEAVQSVYVEGKDKKMPTLVLHIYPPGASPGLTPRGLASKGGDVALAALFRVANSKIDHIWLSKDVPPEGAFPGKEALVSSDLWSRVLAVAGESAGRGPTFHFNDYASQEDALGLGLGSTSTAVSWS
mmetsp:Transcript_71128/g.163006  ORF Transcript_71128/g.163006 Transcript_71128/m.163006 type:complete len:194 (-) Transcript_71128:17-598(-)